MFNKQVIIDKIEQYENISLFFHEIPDLDALGSCYALKNFIRVKYPSKNVKIIGVDTLSQEFGNEICFFDKNPVANSFLNTSLGIILDTANSSRIWTQRQNYCQELIRIDHHPKIETVADYEWIEDRCSSTCQIVAEFLFAWDTSCVTPHVAMYLYAGIVTDTERFLYSSTTPNTYNIVSKLVSVGFDRDAVHAAIYQKDINELLFSSYILKKTKFEQNIGFAWMKIKKHAFEHFDVKLRMSMVHVLNNIKNANIWMTFYYDNVLNVWKGSLRSRKYPINFIAEKYHGGGHKLAAGFTIYNRKEFKKITQDVRDYLKEIKLKKQQMQ